MDFPRIDRNSISLLDASLKVDVVKMEFSNLIFVIISNNGKLGDMVLYEEQTTDAPGFSLSKKSGTYESRTILGCDRDESHLLAKKIATDLKTNKKVIVSSTLAKPISFSDATEICKALTVSDVI